MNREQRREAVPRCEMSIHTPAEVFEALSELRPTGGAGAPWLKKVSDALAALVTGTTDMVRIGDQGLVLMAFPDGLVGIKTPVDRGATS